MLYLFSPQKLRKDGFFIMESITQILQSINSFSKQSFKFSQFIEPLLLLKKLPSDISYELNNDDFIFNLQQAFKHIDWLNDYFKNNINNLLIKEVSKLKNHNLRILLSLMLILLSINLRCLKRIYLFSSISCLF